MHEHEHDNLKSIPNVPDYYNLFWSRDAGWVDGTNRNSRVRPRSAVELIESLLAQGIPLSAV